MTESHDAQDSETKPGPASPREEGSDAPTPPGGPQRQDAAGGGLVEGDKGVGRTAPDSVEDQHGGTIDLEDEQPDPAPTDGDARQEHNAETSFDQPSQ